MLLAHFRKAKHQVMSLLNNSGYIIFEILVSQGNSDLNYLDQLLKLYTAMPVQIWQILRSSHPTRALDSRSHSKVEFQAQ